MRENGKEKAKDARQTPGGPRKIFNPNNEYCHFLPQSAFPVLFHGRARGASNAHLPGMRVHVLGAPGGQHACRGLPWNVPTIGSGLLQPPVNCRLAKEPGEGTAEGNARSQSRTPAVRPGPSPRTPVLSRPRLPAAGPPPLTSACFLALSPPSPPRAL